MTRKTKDGEPDANEFGQLRAFLAQYGVSQADIDGAIGTAPNGRTRDQIATELREWLRTRPKA